MYCCVTDGTIIYIYMFCHTSILKNTEQCWKMFKGRISHETESLLEIDVCKQAAGDTSIARAAVAAAVVLRTYGVCIFFLQRSTKNLTVFACKSRW